MGEMWNYAICTTTHRYPLAHWVNLLLVDLTSYWSCPSCTWAKWKKNVIIRFFFNALIQRIPAFVFTSVLILHSRRNSSVLCRLCRDTACMCCELKCLKSNHHMACSIRDRIRKVWYTHTYNWRCMRLCMYEVSMSLAFMCVYFRFLYFKRQIMVPKGVSYFHWNRVQDSRWITAVSYFIYLHQHQFQL